MHTKTIFAMVALVSALGLVACEQEQGAAERVGKKIDETVEEVGNRLQDTATQLSDAMQETTDKIKQGLGQDSKQAAE